MSSSSSRVGLRARELLFARGTRPTRIVPFPTNRTGTLAKRLPLAAPFTTSQQSQQRGLGKTETRTALEGMTPRIGMTASPQVERAERVATNISEIASSALSILLPGTFVLPPRSRWPKPLGKKIRFLTQWFFMKVQEGITNAAVVFSSKPSLFRRANFEFKRGALIPTAKGLHRSMSEAMAAGDKTTINRICTRRFAAPLLSSIDSRPKGRRYGWEIVKYTNRLFYPSLKSHRLSPISEERLSPMIRQAVVAISSKQRRVAYDAKGEVIPGSEKEMDLVENVVIACLVDPKRAWKQSEWRMIGTIKGTTLESWAEEKAIMNNRMLRK